GSRPAARAIDRERVTFADRVIAPALKAVARFILRLSPRTTRDSIAQRILAAGLANKITADQLLAAKGVLAGGGFLFGLLVGSALGKGQTALVLSLGLGLLGLIGPDFFVNSRITQRREQ